MFQLGKCNGLQVDRVWVELESICFGWIPSPIRKVFYNSFIVSTNVGNFYRSIWSSQKIHFDTFLPFSSWSTRADSGISSAKVKIHMQSIHMLVSHLQCTHARNLRWHCCDYANDDDDDDNRLTTFCTRSNLKRSKRSPIERQSA